MRSKWLRQGTASVLAMLYLILFSVLAIGFYAATTISTEVVQNDRQTSMALLSAESGMEFLRYQLVNVRIPAGTSQSQVLPCVYSELSRLLNNTANMRSQTIGFDGTTISIPAGANNYIAADKDGSLFRATVRMKDGKLLVQTAGRYTRETIVRAIEMGFDRSQRSGIFDFAVASKGRIVTGGSSCVTGSPDSTIANFLSTASDDPTPVVIGGHEIGGNVSITSATANVAYQSGSVGGASDAEVIRSEHIFKGVPEPEFPTVNSAMFRPYATNVYPSGSREKGGDTVYSNIYIPPGSNVHFNARDVIEGVVYVGAGSTVKFNGGATIRGMIVVDQDPKYSIEDTRIEFQGNVDAYGVETLDPAEYGDLTKLTGSFILAPTATIDCQGNFGTVVTGSIIAGSIAIHGSAGGTIKGSIIGMNSDFELNLKNSNSSPITFVGVAKDNPPAGISFTSYFSAIPRTYEEVSP